MTRNKKIVFIFLVVIICVLGFVFFGLPRNSDSGKWNIIIYDATDKSRINNAEIYVTDLNRKYEISESSHTIALPQKPTGIDKSKYPYGYTILTYVKGYLPRIDHNITMGKDNITDIIIELTKPEKFSNQSLTEEFHYSGDIVLVDFINFYLKNID